MIQRKWSLLSLLENNSDGGGNTAGELAHYKFTVSYDGTLYWGFQHQNGHPTIQAEIECALRKIGWNGTHIIGAGRTDRGVHAAGQVFSAWLNWRHALTALVAAINVRLPRDIAILAVQPVADDFHARYDASARCYRYSVYHSEIRDPLKERFFLRVWPELDLETLNKAAAVLIGEHDFRAFGSPPRKNGRTVRIVRQSRWERTQNGTLSFEVEANGFLYHMVRRMVYLQIQLACGLISWEDWQKAIELGQPAKQGIVPPHGLSLHSVHYEPGTESKNRSYCEVENSLEIGENDCGKDLCH